MNKKFLNMPIVRGYMMSLMLSAIPIFTISLCVWIYLRHAMRTEAEAAP